MARARICLFTGAHDNSETGETALVTVEY